ncbi:hypothetical protein U5N59_17830 [Niallia circulans]|nr:hypothetical protein [Niallia circulans]
MEYISPTVASPKEGSGSFFNLWAFFPKNAEASPSCKLVTANKAAVIVEKPAIIMAPSGYLFW